ncbi:MAG: hypothetical protein ACYS29_18645 [Planctomycetota bacterium]
MNNVAGDPKYAKVKHELASALLAELFATKDPRVLGTGDAFDKYHFYR